MDYTKLKIEFIFTDEHDKKVATKLAFQDDMNQFNIDEFADRTSIHYRSALRVVAKKVDELELK